MKAIFFLIDIIIGIYTYIYTQLRLIIRSPGQIHIFMLTIYIWQILIPGSGDAVEPVILFRRFESSNQRACQSMPVVEQKSGGNARR
jgi:hypothetical protein